MAPFKLHLVVYYVVLIAMMSSHASLQESHPDGKFKPDTDRATVQSGVLDKPPRSNKVSVLLRLAYQKSRQQTGALLGQSSPSSGETTDKYSTMYDDQILMSLCPKRLTIICNLAIQSALSSYPEKLFDLVTAIRTKPDSVKANKLILHKLLESAIESIEYWGIDSAISSGIDFAASKNPYVLIASKALDIILNRISNTS